MSRHRKRPASVLSDESSLPEYDNSIARSGKWTAEEESFANRLIVEFEAGTLTDCEDGCTLRSYLARKLNCAPMRISKKFAGQCIGKHIFTRKDTLSHSSESLQQLESSFRQSFKNDGDIKRSKIEKEDSLSSAHDDMERSNSLSTSPSFDSFHAFTQLHHNQNAPKDQGNIYSYQLPSFDVMEIDMEDMYSSSYTGTSLDMHQQGIHGHKMELEEWKDVLTFFCGHDDNNTTPILDTPTVTPNTKPAVNPIAPKTNSCLSKNTMKHSTSYSSLLL